jgi:hypothetical protein
MIPYKIINASGLPDHVKEIAIKDTQERYALIKGEIIENNAIIVIDFMNSNYSLKWKVMLENASNDLSNKFNCIK